MTDITEFITARLDEDERDTRSTGIPGAAIPRRYVQELRAVKVQRAIVAGHSVSICTHPGVGAHRQCGFCSSGGFPSTAAGSDLMGIEGDWPCPTLRLLASQWSDHPDYQQEWSVA